MSAGFDSGQAPSAEIPATDIHSRGSFPIVGIGALAGGLLSRNSTFEDYEVTHDFEQIGRRRMLLNARRIVGGAHYILLSIVDVTERDDYARKETAL